MNGQRGISLMEIVLYFAVMAIILMIAVPSFQGWIDSRKLGVSAQTTVTFFRFARMKAAAHQETYQILVDAAANEISLIRDPGGANETEDTYTLEGGISFKSVPVTDFRFTFDGQIVDAVGVGISIDADNTDAFDLEDPLGDVIRITVFPVGSVNKIVL